MHEDQVKRIRFYAHKTRNKTDRTDNLSFDTEGYSKDAVQFLFRYLVNQGLIRTFDESGISYVPRYSISSHTVRLRYMIREKHIRNRFNTFAGIKSECGEEAFSQEKAILLYDFSQQLVNLSYRLGGSLNTRTYEYYFKIN